MPPNSLNSTALPSITGIAASGPMSPRPSTAVPSETTATVFDLIVRFQAASGESAIARQIRATPGVYAIERSSRVLSGTFERDLELPAQVHEEGAIGDVQHLDARRSHATASTMRLQVIVVGRGDRHVAHLVVALGAHEVDRTQRSARVPDRLREPGERARRVGETHADRGRERGGEVAHVRITPSAASAAISSSP